MITDLFKSHLFSSRQGSGVFFRVYKIMNEQKDSSSFPSTWKTLLPHEVPDCDDSRKADIGRIVEGFFLVVILTRRRQTRP
jgi:hypothetical protein